MEFKLDPQFSGSCCHQWSKVESATQNYKVSVSIYSPSGYSGPSACAAFAKRRARPPVSGADSVIASSIVHASVSVQANLSIRVSEVAGSRAGLSVIVQFAPLLF